MPWIREDETPAIGNPTEFLSTSLVTQSSLTPSATVAWIRRSGTATLAQVQLRTLAHEDSLRREEWYSPHIAKEVEFRKA